MTWASSASVLASRPVARAKSRIWRGLTTASGRAGAGQRGSHGDLEPAGCLEHDQRRGQVTQIIDQLFKTFAIARDGKGPA